MIQVRRNNERGHIDHGWLDTHHTFSFAHYIDRRFMGFRSLRVINEDTVTGGEGFGMHSHQDMEILTYVLQGALEHKDSMGNIGVIRPGELQRMSAGTGVQHSEYNHSRTEPVHLLQIWILPERDGIAPSYEEARFSEESRRAQLRLVASNSPAAGAVKIHQDAHVFVSLLAGGESVELPLATGRGAWIQDARGAVKVNGQELVAGDGAAIENESVIRIEGADEKQTSEFLLFDLK